jgi:DNA-directed RNA polymerase specialized sigma24 family protein
MTKQEQAAELLKATGLTYRDIARRVGCSRATVKKAAHNAGIAKPKPPRIAP